MSDLQPLLTTHVIPPERAADYLRAMDIEVADLYAAIAEGERLAGMLGAYAPPTAAGYLWWAGAVGELRRRLAASGRWAPADRKGQPISRHLATRSTLAVMSGDVLTGDPQSASGPHNARAKGAATARSFRPDEALFPLEPFRHARGVDGALAGTWVMLYRKDGEAIHLEVSQPVGFDLDSGQFTGWSVRVILGDWRPGARNGPPVLGTAIDLQLVRSVA